MRESLALKEIFLPSVKSTNNLDNVQKKLDEWSVSGLSNYRKILDPNSNCYPDVKSIEEIANYRRKGGYKNLVILGTGGSSLGGETIIHALHSKCDYVKFYFADNNDPYWFTDLLESLNPVETLFYVVSKSGKTPETLSQFIIAWNWIKKIKAPEEHFILCTDPEVGDLRKFAKQKNLICFDIPPSVGGRFSVLTAVGLFPAAFAGLDIRSFIEGAKSVSNLDLYSIVESLVACQKERPITVLMPYSSQLSVFSKWFCQLWAESLGKSGNGLTPYPALGTTDQHSQMQLYVDGPRDKTIIFIHVKNLQEQLWLDVPPEMNLPFFMELNGFSMDHLFNAEFKATRDTLIQQDVPNFTIELDSLDEHSLGALFYLFESMTEIAGAYLNINPFDQPGVENAKILTKNYLVSL